MDAKSLRQQHSEHRETARVLASGAVGLGGWTGGRGDSGKCWEPPCLGPERPQGPVSRGTVRSGAVKIPTGVLRTENRERQEETQGEGSEAAAVIQQRVEAAGADGGERGGQVLNHSSVSTGEQQRFADKSDIGEK